MNRELVIDSIMNTYEVSQKIKDNVRKITSERMEEFSINAYTEIYKYIAFLIDKFQTPYKEHFFARLDSPINNNSKMLYHETISDQKSNPNQRESFENRKKKDLESISLDDIIDILEPHMDDFYLNLIKRLGEKNTLRFNISPEYLIKNASEIQERLENLIEKYGEIGMSVISKRPIVNIQFSPLSIKFKQRNYHGNPLALFMKHKNIYEGLSRSQLKKLDGGFYKALLKADQLKLAIPEIGSFPRLKSIPLEKIKKINAIIEAYKNCKIARKVSRRIGVSTPTVTKYWRKHGLEIRKRGGDNRISSLLL